MTRKTPIIAGARYMLPSGNVVRVLPLPARDVDGVSCQYMHPDRLEVSLNNKAWRVVLTGRWMRLYARQVS